MNPADMIILCLILLAVVLALRHMITTRKKGGCGCGCSGCSAPCSQRAGKSAGTDGSCRQNISK